MGRRRDAQLRSVQEQRRRIEKQLAVEWDQYQKQNNYGLLQQGQTLYQQQYDQLSQHVPQLLQAPQPQPHRTLRFIENVDVAAGTAPVCSHEVAQEVTRYATEHRIRFAATPETIMSIVTPEPPISPAPLQHSTSTSTSSIETIQTLAEAATRSETVITQQARPQLDTAAMPPAGNRMIPPEKLQVYSSIFNSALKLGLAGAGIKIENTSIVKSPTHNGLRDEDPFEEVESKLFHRVANAVRRFKTRIRALGQMHHGGRRFRRGSKDQAQPNPGPTQAPTMTSPSPEHPHSNPSTSTSSPTIPYESSPETTQGEGARPTPGPTPAIVVPPNKKPALRQYDLTEDEIAQFFDEFEIPQLSASELQYLKHSTYLTEHEIKLLYKDFMVKVHPELAIVKKRQLLLFFPHLTNSHLLSALFRALDVDNDSRINFDDYCTSIGIICRGSSEEQIEVTFRIIDADKDNFVSKKEVYNTVKIVSTLMTELDYQPERYGSPREVTENIFRKDIADQMEQQRMEKKPEISAEQKRRPPRRSIVDLRPSAVRDRMKRRVTSAMSTLQRSVSASAQRDIDTDADNEFEADEVRHGATQEATHERRSRARRPSMANFKRKYSVTKTKFKRNVNEQMQRFYDEERGLTREQFKQRCLYDPDIAQCFGLFNYIYHRAVRNIEIKLASQGVGRYRLLLTGIDDARPVKEGFLVKKKSGVITDFNFHYFSCADGFLSYYLQKEDKEPRRVICLLGASIKRADNAMGIPNCFFLKAGNYSRYFVAGSEEETEEWMWALRANAEMKEYPSQSSFPIRFNCKGEWFIKGKSYYASLYETLLSAKEEIFICGWAFSPQLLLIREEGQPFKDEYRLDYVLKKKAEDGVKIYILVWNAINVVFDLAINTVIEYMESLHENIKVNKHPKTFPFAWSPHNKVVIVDQRIAYVGGMDLCFNRYDDERLLVTDPEEKVFPGTDYCNPNLRDFDAYHPFQNVLDRNTQPRLPWHDVHMKVVGPVTRDASFHFIQYWNHAKVNSTNPARLPYLRLKPDLLSASLLISPSSSRTKEESNRNSSSSKKIDNHGDLLEQDVAAACSSSEERIGYIDDEKHTKTMQSASSTTGSMERTCICQFLRSACDWSVGLPGVERSLFKAMIEEIKKAEHFIYIESQYFITSTSRKGRNPSNTLAKALVERISTAIYKEQRFQVVVLLPCYPAGVIATTSQQMVVKLEMESIYRGPHSIYRKLQKKFPFAKISNYIRFFSLRNWGFLPDGTPITEQVYVHTKLMIVDDRVAIIGSANINDRSLKGTRDLETAIKIKDTALVESTMNGLPYRVGKFPHELRVNLWKQHLGLHKHENQDEVYQMLRDPIADATYRGLWLDTAIRNTDIYLQVFRKLPDNIKRAGDLIYVNGKRPRPEDVAKLNDIRGFLVMFPSKFLKHDRFIVRLVNKNYLVPKKIFA